MFSSRSTARSLRAVAEIRKKVGMFEYQVRKEAISIEIPHLPAAPPLDFCFYLSVIIIIILLLIIMMINWAIVSRGGILLLGSQSDSISIRVGRYLHLSASDEVATVNIIPK